MIDDSTGPPDGQISGMPALRRTSTPAAGPPVYVANPYTYEAAEGDVEVGLFQYWAVICRHRGAILLASLGGLLLGFLVSFAMKPIYLATTTLEVLALNENFMNMRETNPVDNSTDSDVSEEDTQAQLMSSATLLKRVNARLDPLSPSGPRTKLRVPVPAWQQFLHLNPAWLQKLHLDSVKADGTRTNGSPAPSPHAVLIAKAAATLKVKSMPHTRIIEATIKSSDPHLAADFLNVLSQEFIAQNQESRLIATQHTGDWLNRELNDARDKLRQSEDAIQEYAKNTGLVYTNETTNVATEKLQQYQQALSNATADRIAKQARLELARSSPPESLAEVLNDATLRDLQLKITDLKRQVADLSTVFNPEFSKVRRVQAELTSLQAAFDRNRVDVLNRIRTDYEESLRKENLLRGAYDEQTVDVTGQGEKAIQYNILKRDVESNRQLYDAMLQQMKQASIATAMRASSVRVVDPADVPLRPVSPSFALNSALGLLAGLLLSTAGVLIRSEADRTFRSHGDIKQWTELPELGTIPNANGEGGSYYLYKGSWRSGRVRKFRLRFSITSSPSAGGDVELGAWQGSATLLAESFRSILTSILTRDDKGRRPQVIVVSSANPAEGKTTAVTNIAIAAAEIGMKVLVIDADLRRPRLHRMLNLANEHGLVDWLQQPPADGMALIVRSPNVPNLHVLTSGSEATTAAQLFHSPKFAALIKHLRVEYDMILIDTPPMLQMTDARIISKQCDGVILVARAGQTSREALRAAKERFQEDRTPVLGSVLNDWDPKRSFGKYSHACSR